jgi:hypothetical protein
MSHSPWVPDIDLGDGHSLIWTDWDPDPVLNPQWAHLPPEAPGEHHGAIVRHPVGPSLDRYWNDDLAAQGLCESGISFDTARNREGSWQPQWQVQSWDPLTLSPSLACRACGDHGFIREGRWVRA